MGKMLKFLRLCPRDRRLFLSAILLLVVARVGLALLSFQKLVKVIDKLGQAFKRPNHSDPSLPDRIAWAIEKAGRYAPGAKCLCRALAGQVLLSWYGIPSNLRIGVLKKSESELEAHAWVESEGRVLVGDLEDLSRYALLPPLMKTIL